MTDRTMVAEFLSLGDVSDSQIIDLLLLLLDDWQIREQVMKCMRKRELAEKERRTITQTVKTTGDSINQINTSSKA